MRSMLSMWPTSAGSATSPCAACTAVAAPAVAAPAVAAPAVAAPAVPEQEPVHPVPVDVGAVMPEKRGGNGSLGHPHLCRRPCIRFSKGECNMGDACEYCHLQHERRPTFDKRQRILMRDMDT